MRDESVRRVFRFPRILLNFGFLAALLVVAIGPTDRVSLSADTVLIPTGAVWKYLDDGSNQGSAWTSPAFIDSDWKSGMAQLGYGDGDEATVVGYGPNASNKYVTTYFRCAFAATGPSAFTSLNLRVLRDDGAVVYLNGTELYRTNMPEGAVAFTTPASTALGGADETAFVQAVTGTSALIAGTNVLAVEIHQANATSTDISFDLELKASNSVSVTRGPYLQLMTPDSATIRWRTNVPVNSVVRYGTSPTNLEYSGIDSALVTEHELTLSQLTPDALYYYSVGNGEGPLAGGSDFAFYTAPAPGTTGPTRIWATSDMGWGGANPAAVRDAYLASTGGRYTDVWLTMGDNEQHTGLDSDYQTVFFDMYPALLRQSAVWTALGNHDVNGSSNPPPDYPYYQNFTLPVHGEAGGIASATEDYYSFDYANIHFVCLDSITSSRSASGEMLTWLEQDLAANNREWLIAYWHYPPYTKGTHDSDTETGLIEMRQNALPILESHGVDLVLCGHSHVYERSFLIDSHYGHSSTFAQGMKLNGGDGRYGGGGEYQKIPGPHAGTIYVVAGTGGTTGTGSLNHPAMYMSRGGVLGSVVLDIEGSRLDATFLDNRGTVLDYFTILKSRAENIPPAVSITSPANGASFVQAANISLNADATDGDGTVARVEFWMGSGKLGEDSTKPYQFTWNNAPVGTHALTAKAYDNLGAATTSAPVTITVNSPTVPAPPTGLLAIAAKRQIKLTWTQSGTTGVSENVIYRSATTGGPYNIQAVIPAANAYIDRPLKAGKKYYYVVTARIGSLESTVSNQASATAK